MNITMYKLYLLTGLLILQGCKRQNAGQEFYSQEFDWKIIIPAGFEKMEDKEAEELQRKGLDAIEKTYQTEIESRTRKIAVFKSGKFNFVEANYQSFDPETDGSHEEANKLTKEVLYQTYSTQMEGTAVDTLSSRETISGKEFDKFTLDAKFPNDLTLHTIMYTRLFGKWEFTFLIVYMDEEKGQEMIAAWKSSVFAGKTK